MKLLVFILAIACSISSCVEVDNPPKNIILFIGDGMGVSQISAAKVIKSSLNIEQLSVSGLLTTHSKDFLVTDSAAASTALATGYKTNNGVISQLADGTALKTIIEYAIEKQMTTGIVVSSSITHATPATFLAHIDSRKKHSEIAEQIAAGQVDVLFGGGWGYFVPQTVTDSLRTDDKDLLAELKKQRKVIQTEKEFLDFNAIEPVIGLFAVKHPQAADLRQPGLAQLTRKAIEILTKLDTLENNKGFFLMVEGSQIDWAGHKNDQTYLMNEMIDFDDAVGIGLDYAKSNSQTLLVVTSDHETGGFAIHDGSIARQEISQASFSSTNHTATMVPVFAYGPGSALFSGIHDNTYVGKGLIEYILKPE